MSSLAPKIKNENLTNHNSFQSAIYSNLHSLHYYSHLLLTFMTHIHDSYSLLIIITHAYDSYTLFIINSNE